MKKIKASGEEFYGKTFARYGNRVILAVLKDSYNFCHCLIAIRFCFVDSLSFGEVTNEAPRRIAIVFIDIDRLRDS